MRISIVTVHIPFATGGAEYHTQSLQRALTERGHNVELIRIPFLWTPTRALIRSTMAARMLSVDAGSPDLVIGMRFPAYLVPFANKKLWLIHQHRQLYDLWGTPYQDIPNTPDGLRARETLIKADNACLRQVKAIYTTSRNLAQRLMKYNGIEATAVLPAPLPSPDLYWCGRADDYFLYVSRVDSLKRQLMAVTAMRYVKSNFTLLIAGPVSDRKYQAFLDTAVSAYHLEDRVQFLGPVSDEEKASLIANATGVVFTPYDEDYGYVTLEALQSSKPVITCHDSGGVTEFVEDGVNGLVVAPDAREVAQAMERLFADKQKAAEMGRAGRALLDARHINWDTVVDALLAP